MNPARRPVLFFLFLFSGFCGLVYQVVWTRLAFASFGIITPVLSVVISVFMLGLAAGSWAGGRWIEPLERRTGLPAVFYYAMVELIIGLGAFAVPKLFGLGERLLLTSGQSNSTQYLVLSALVLGTAILPWCICMGTTFPFMMAYLKRTEKASSESFSYLYLANVIGATAGTLVTALVLVEVLGFRGTLQGAALVNFGIAGTACWLGFEQRRLNPIAPSSTNTPRDTEQAQSGSSFAPWLLFTTGFVSMAMEVVWTRAFAPVLKTQVYSFALVVAAYLTATFVGSTLYRRELKQGRVRSTASLVGLLCVAAFLPPIVNDVRLVKADWQWYADSFSVVLLLASICPFCGVLGYLTPALIDNYSGGNPSAGGKAYALNVLGCIAGPLFACYILLPLLSERQGLVALAIPLFAFLVVLSKQWRRSQQAGYGALTAATLLVSLLASRDYEGYLVHTEKQVRVRRDYTASVISFGQNREKHLLVNGIGMTMLTPITKFMVHLPLAFHSGPPESALIICFGMGTSYRAALSWDIKTTAVELVPSVWEAFDFYHADARSVSKNPKGEVVVDDGRRFLKRTNGKYDVIVIDPPPPPEAAGSSLLYSVEFYQLAKAHLNTNGILQAWVPGDNGITSQAAIRSVCESFPYVRCFGSVEEGGSGLHLLASLSPIHPAAVAELVGRMPAGARRDLLEWCEGMDLPTYLQQVTSREISLQSLMHPDPGVRISDDRPFNEYFFIRNLDLF